MDPISIFMLVSLILTSLNYEKFSTLLFETLAWYDIVGVAVDWVVCEVNREIMETKKLVRVDAENKGSVVDGESDVDMMVMHRMSCDGLCEVHYGNCNE
ncbi:hypothetical protein Tco_0138959 [Tanacetum coccineum]